MRDDEKAYIHRFALWLLAAALLCIAVAVKAEPLPENDEHRFYALVNCGSVVAFMWVTPDNVYLAPAQGIQSQEALDRVIEARDRAAEQGNAYVVRMNPSGECREA